MSNTITAYFKGRAGVAESVYQYDYGKVLIIDGLNLPAVFEVHFTTLSEESAITAIGQNNRVAIPDSCLSIPGIVTAYIYLHSGDNDGETEYVIRFAVNRRARPDYDEDEKSDWESAASQALAILQNLPKKVNNPLDEHNQVTYGNPGQLLRTKGDGSTEWVDEGLPTDEQTAEAVAAWLDDHPEATTTVQDGSLTEAKFSAALKLKAIKDYVTPEMFGAVGDGVADDTDAIKAAVAASDSILFANKYKVTDTIYLPGGKNLDIFGTIHHPGSGILFYMSHQFNNINGHNIGTITGDGGDGTLIYITTTDEGGTEKYSYWNKITNISIRESAIGVFLYNPETTTASYFNTIEKCTITSCPIGIYLKGYANGNRINNIVFYNCGVANDLTYASMVFEEENGKYPEENNVSQIFVTNSFDTVCFLIKGQMDYSNFSEIIVEPGGQSRSFYSTDYSKIRHCTIDILDLSYWGFNANVLGAGCNVIATGGIITNSITSKRINTPLSRIMFFENSNAYPENTWIPLLTPSTGDNRSFRVSLTLYVGTGTMFASQYYDELNTVVYKYQGVYYTRNTDKFKIEDGKLYFLSQPVVQGGNGLYYKIKLEIGSYYRVGIGQDVNYSMDSVWTEL